MDTVLFSFLFPHPSFSFTITFRSHIRSFPRVYTLVFADPDTQESPPAVVAAVADTKRLKSNSGWSEDAQAHEVVVVQHKGILQVQASVLGAAVVVEVVAVADVFVVVLVDTDDYFDCDYGDSVG